MIASVPIHPNADALPLVDDLGIGRQTVDLSAVPKAEPLEEVELTADQISECAQNLDLGRTLRPKYHRRLARRRFVALGGAVGATRTESFRDAGHCVRLNDQRELRHALDRSLEGASLRLTRLHRRDTEPADLPPDADSYRCGSCRKLHRGLAFAFAVDAPLAWDQLAEADRGEDSVLDGELCVINNEHHFIRGLLEIPVTDADATFAWNVWSSLSPETFERAINAWDSPDRASEPPYFGWLSTDLAAVYPTTLNLALNVHTRPIGQRPFFEVEPTEHPLAVEQRPSRPLG